MHDNRITTTSQHSGEFGLRSDRSAYSFGRLAADDSKHVECSMGPCYMLLFCLVFDPSSYTSLPHSLILSLLLPFPLGSTGRRRCTGIGSAHDAACDKRELVPRSLRRASPIPLQPSPALSPPTRREPPPLSSSTETPCRGPQCAKDVTFSRF